MTTGPQGPAAAGRDRLRAGHADREQVIDTLKTAFADGRLDKDELNDRVGQTLAARTYADLAAVTADIFVAPVQAPPPRRVARPLVTKQAVKWGLVAAGAMIPPAMFVAGAYGVGSLALLAFPLLAIEMIVAIIFVAVTLASQRRDRSRAPRGQLPPRPGQPGRACTEQARADLPARKPRLDRPHRGGQAVPVSRGARPAPGAAWAATASS